MIEVRAVFDSGVKSDICNNILRALPNWFGMESGIIDYVSQVRALPVYAAFDGGQEIGFVAVKVHSAYTVEVCVMGVLQEYHRQGIGKALIERCEGYCTENAMEFLTVKTLDESRASRSYEKTRLFYLAMGFRPLEVFPLLWDENNPCLFMAKYVGIR